MNIWRYLLPSQQITSTPSSSSAYQTAVVDPTASDGYLEIVRVSINCLREGRVAERERCYGWLRVEGLTWLESYGR
jgi:hypothetical protein